MTCLGPCVTPVQGEDCCLDTKTSRDKKWRRSVLVAGESKFQPPQDICPSHLVAQGCLRALGWPISFQRLPLCL